MRARGFAYLALLAPGDRKLARWRHRRRLGWRPKGAITSKIKHAIKHKTSPAKLAQLLRPSLAFCFSFLQPMTAYRPGLDGTPPLAAS